MRMHVSECADCLAAVGQRRGSEQREGVSSERPPAAGGSGGCLANRKPGAPRFPPLLTDTQAVP